MHECYCYFATGLFQTKAKEATDYVKKAQEIAKDRKLAKYQVHFLVCAVLGAAADDELDLDSNAVGFS